MINMAFFEIRQLAVTLGKQQVFSHLDLDLEAGELVTLLGQSGCGKSTLLRCMSGLITPNTGSLTMDGQDITRLPAQARGIGMVFQQYALFPNMTVAQNVAFGLKMQKIPEAERAERVRDMLALVELDHKQDVYPEFLSGGQKQRVALARALVMRPKMLLLDEPLSALDARIRRHLREQIRTIQQQLKVPMVFVTHDREEALTLSDRIVLMDQGKVVESGPANQLYSQPATSFTAEFLSQANILDAEQARRLFGLAIRDKLAIRPEMIRIGRSESDTAEQQFSLPAKILSSQRLGNLIRYQLQAEQVDFMVDQLCDGVQDSYHTGMPVELLIGATALHEVKEWQ